jgi:hypothetical protein
MGTLLLADCEPNSHHPFARQWFARELQQVFSLDEIQFRNFLDEARTQRVLRRILEVLKNNLSHATREHTSHQVSAALSGEKARVQTALRFLRCIVDEFERRGETVMVIKTLDHWPDTGSDIDLLTDAAPETVSQIFESQFGAQQEPQSWGDHLASKFNFRLPGLAELVEIHVGCLGQTGEQKVLAQKLLARQVYEVFGERLFPVPPREDRMVIAALQRMYRHFYIRLTDIVNITNSVMHNRVDFEALKEISEVGAVWPGVATLLVIARQQAICCGRSFELPEGVKATAKFNHQRTYLARSFVRVPILPEGAGLFMRQLVENGKRHDFRAVMRLSLLPMLATAAYVSLGITGNDKGIW